MQERAYGTVKNGTVELASALPEGAPVDVIVLGAPLDVIHRLRTRQTIDWQEESFVDGEGVSIHVERMDPEVPAILRANGAETQFAIEQDLLLRHFPELVSRTIEAEEDREVPGVLWVATEALLPAEADPQLISQRINAFIEDRCRAVPHRQWDTLHLTYDIRHAGD